MFTSVLYPPQELLLLFFSSSNFEKHHMLSVSPAAAQAHQPATLPDLNSSLAKSHRDGKKTHRFGICRRRRPAYE